MQFSDISIRIFSLVYYTPCHPRWGIGSGRSDNPSSRVYLKNRFTSLPDFRMGRYEFPQSLGKSTRILMFWYNIGYNISMVQVNLFLRCTLASSTRIGKTSQGPKHAKSFSWSTENAWAYWTINMPHTDWVVTWAVKNSFVS